MRVLKHVHVETETGLLPLVTVRSHGIKQFDCYINDFGYNINIKSLIFNKKVPIRSGWYFFMLAFVKNAHPIASSTIFFGLTVISTQAGLKPLFTAFLADRTLDHAQQ